MTPPLDCFRNEESVDEIIHSIRAIFNDSGGRSVLLDSSTDTNLLAHCARHMGKGGEGLAGAAGAHGGTPRWFRVDAGGC